MWQRRFTIVMGVVLGAALCMAWGERAIVELKDGRQLRGEVRETATEIIIDTPLGEVRFDRDEVAKVTPLVDDAPAEKPQETGLTDGRTRLGDDVAAEFRRKFTELAADDIEGHFKLAEWARDRNRFDLVAPQCRYILGMKPDHRNARLLLSLAEERIQQRKQRDAKPDSRPAPLMSNKIPPPPLLSDRDIQRLRLGEILARDGNVERLRISFTRKAGQRNLIDEVAEAIRDMSIDPADQRALERGRPPDQLRVILKYTGMRFADRIEIEEDPEVFQIFRRDVLPILYNGCARSGCHGGEAAQVFRLPARNVGRKDAAPYTAFAILDQFETANGPLINRRDPIASPLLDYMLPPNSNDVHAKVRQFQPLAQSSREKTYTTVLEWIRRLKEPRPEYGLDRTYRGYCPVQPDASATSQPVEEEPSMQDESPETPAANEKSGGEH